MRTFMALTLSVLVAAVACSDSGAPDSLTGVAPAFNDAEADCAAELQQLRTNLQKAIDDGAFLSRNPHPDKDDAAALQGKIDGAVAKLGEGKFEDARLKLLNFESKVMELRDAAKPKITEAAAGSLLGAVAEAIACVDGLITGDASGETTTGDTGTEEATTEDASKQDASD